MIRFLLFVTLFHVALFSETLTFGVFTYRAPEKIIKEYQPIADHLSRELNATVLIKPLSQEELELEVNKGKIDIIATNPTHYISLRTQGRITGSIATLIKRYGNVSTPYLGGVIITRRDRGDIRTLEDFKGKSIAIPGKKFLGGFQTQAYELATHGIDIDRDVQIMEVKNHEAVVKAVLAGKADIGFIRSGIIEELQREGTIDPKNLFVINERHFSDFPLHISTSLYPEWSIVTKQELPAAKVSKIAVALYDYESSNGGYDVIAGFTIPGDYGGIDNLARILRIPPYNYAPAFTLNDIWMKYGITILVVSGLTLLFLLIIGWMVRKIHFQQLYVRSILDTSPNPMIVTDGKDLVEANKALLSLLGYETLEALKREHSCVCDFFEEGETDEYLLPMMDDQTWIEYILAFPNREHKVKIIVGGNMMLFKIDTSLLETAQLIRYIVIFTDISSIMIQSNTDALTGIANRTHFNLIYEHALHATQREDEELSIIFFDIDHFKNVNDIFGHLVGDEVLHQMAYLVKNTLRKSDMLARWGGEEFIILLLNTPLSSAVEVAEALRELIEKEPFEVVEHITCSFGVSALRANEQGDELLKRVDELLYKAKNSGRNRVVIG